MKLLLTIVSDVTFCVLHPAHKHNYPQEKISEFWLKKNPILVCHPKKRCLNFAVKKSHSCVSPQEKMLKFWCEKNHCCVIFYKDDVEG